MNEYYLRITDKANIEHPLDDETEYQITGIFTTNGFTSKPLHEGSQKITFTAQFTSHLEILKGEKKIRVQDKKRNGQKNRGAIYAFGQELGVPDDEAFYDIFCNKFRANLPAIWEMVKDK